MQTINYNRADAVSYARRWAFGRNPDYYIFDTLGGDCTNFVSQCIFAGAGQMNYTPDFGWYYISVTDRAAAWTGVTFLYNFLTTNEGLGPFATEVNENEIRLGDVIQLGNNTDGFYHTLIIVGFDGEDPLIAAQTNDAYRRPLSTYDYDFLRYIKILGVRFEVDVKEDCFDSVFNGIAIVTPGTAPIMREDGKTESDGIDNNGTSPAIAPINGTANE